MIEVLDKQTRIQNKDDLNDLFQGDIREQTAIYFRHTVSIQANCTPYSVEHQFLPAPLVLNLRAD